MKEYNHLKIEKKWQKEWEKKKVFVTKENSKKDKFYVLDMFPYPSGEGLHVGHPKGYIATDVVSRTKRMQGFSVLHPMGFDAFGLPAENYAIKMKTNPMIAVKKNVGRFKKQLEILGLDYDWTREVNTTNPKFYKWTQWIFLKLLEKGLAYESWEPINWCPKDKTGLANEDVVDGRCERCGTLVEKKPMRQWVLSITDYANKLLSGLDSLDWPKSIKDSQKNWIGKSEGSEIDFPIKNTSEKIKIFTTRPDTIFGATYVVLAPESNLLNKIENQIQNIDEVKQYINDAKKKTEIDRTSEGKEKTGVEIKGIKAINPANKEEIPVFVADYVLSAYGTGAVMAVPAHDGRDFEFAKKYNLPIKHVIEPVTGKSLPNEEFRRSIVAVVENPKTGKILCLDWTDEYGGILLIGGGLEKDEDPVTTAKREILEETGYKNLQLIGTSGKSYHHYFAYSKNVARNIEVTGVYFKLIDEERDEQMLEDNEKNRFDVLWLSKDEIEKKLQDENHAYQFQYFVGNKPYTGVGKLTASGKFDGKNSEEVQKEITEFVGGKWVTKFKLRDWVFSRQRYWGEPIPVVHCEKCGVVPLPEKDLPLKLPKVKNYEPTDNGESPLASITSWVNTKCPKCKGKAKRETNTMPQWAGSSWYYLRYMDPKNNKKLVDPKKEKYWNQVDLYVGGAEHATRHLIYARFWHKFLNEICVVSTKEPFKKLQHVGLIMAEDGRKMSKRYGNVVNPDDIVSTFGADTLRVYEMFMGPFDQAISWDTNSISGSRRFIERVWRLQTKVSKTAKADKKIESILHNTIKKVSSDIEDMKFNTAISSLMILVNEFEKQEAITRLQLELLVTLLSPFAPHITEEIWQNLGNKKLLSLQKWPKADAKKMLKAVTRLIIQIDGKVRAQVETSNGLDEKEATALAKNLPDVDKWLVGKKISKIIYIQDRLLNFVTE